MMKHLGVFPSDDDSESTTDMIQCITNGPDHCNLCSLSMVALGDISADKEPLRIRKFLPTEDTGGVDQKTPA